MELKELIETYGKHDDEFKQLKKVCDSEKEELKGMLLAANKDSDDAGGYTVTRVVQHRESFNEEKGIEILKAHGVTGVIKTKEYIDMDALENAGYSGEVPKEVLLELDSCRETKEVVTLTCKKTKTKKGE